MTGPQKATAPLGAERVFGDALWRKVAMTGGDTMSMWKRVNHLNWEEANGPIPEGFVLKSRDGNSLNVEASNWVLMPKGMVGPCLRRIADAPPDMKETAIANELLKIRITKLRVRYGLRDEKALARISANRKNRYAEERRRRLEDPIFAEQFRSKAREKLDREKMERAEARRQRNPSQTGRGVEG